MSVLVFIFVQHKSETFKKYVVPFPFRKLYAQCDMGNVVVPSQSWTATPETNSTLIWPCPMYAHTISCSTKIWNQSAKTGHWPCWLGACYGWFHLYGLSWAAKNAKFKQNEKMSTVGFQPTPGTILEWDKWIRHLPFNPKSMLGVGSNPPVGKIFFTFWKSHCFAILAARVSTMTFT